MTRRLKLISIGDSVGVILPDEILSRFSVKVGDELYINEIRDGIELRTIGSEFAEDMTIAERVMREDYEVLKKLAE